VSQPVYLSALELYLYSKKSLIAYVGSGRNDSVDSLPIPAPSSKARSPGLQCGIVAQRYTVSAVLEAVLLGGKLHSDL